MEMKDNSAAFGRRYGARHLSRRELPELGAGRARRRPVQLPRLLSKRQRSVQREADLSVQQTNSIRATPCSLAAVHAAAYLAA